MHYVPGCRQSDFSGLVEGQNTRIEYPSRGPVRPLILPAAPGASILMPRTKSSATEVAMTSGPAPEICTHIVDENGHGDHVLHSAAANRLDGLVQLGEDFAHLTIEVGIRRAGLAAEPDDLSAVGGDRA